MHIGYNYGVVKIAFKEMKSCSSVDRSLDSKSINRRFESGWGHVCGLQLVTSFHIVVDLPVVGIKGQRDAATAVWVS